MMTRGFYLVSAALGSWCACHHKPPFSAFIWTCLYVPFLTSIFQMVRKMSNNHKMLSPQYREKLFLPRGMNLRLQLPLIALDKVLCSAKKKKSTSKKENLARYIVSFLSSSNANHSILHFCLEFQNFLTSEQDKLIGEYGEFSFFFFLEN